LVSCDAITQIGRQSRLKFIIEFAHFIKEDNHVGFYELSILCPIPSSGGGGGGAGGVPVLYVIFFLIMGF
jgi:hypothetical protein